ncbi:MAG TPA: hypothetical protein DCY42_02890 [Chloroflexi bacterium]|nr:hypothetical protein [Chloroflexota bacterium]
MMKNLAIERAEIYQVFSNDKRVLIFWYLAKNHEMSVNELAEAIDSTIQNTSQHLRLMKAKDILESTRSGQTILYRIANTKAGRYSLYIHRQNFEEIERTHLVEETFDFDITLPDNYFDR